MKKIIWFLMDNRMGSVGQAKGIIQALDKERYEIVEKKIDYNRLASTLSVSRASLYRVMDELEREGRIAREGKRILIKEVNHKE